MSRILLGGFAGIAATVAMSAAMRRLQNAVSRDQRYPLPPRQIVDQVGWSGNERSKRTLTIFAHVGYGALMGSLFAFLPRRIGGTRFGLAVWALSYLGWIPACGILSPAASHPVQRTFLMLAAHLVWGSTLGNSLSELETSRIYVFGRSLLQANRDEPEVTTAPTSRA